MHPFRRFWARFFDYLIPFNFLALLLNIFVPAWRETAYWQALWLSTLAIALWIPVEAAFDTTPGKALLRVAIFWHDRPTYDIRLRRAVGVWLKGMGAGIPILNLIFPIRSYAHLSSAHSTEWDDAVHTRIVHHPIGAVRIVVFILLVIVVDSIGFRAIGDFFGTFFLMEDIDLKWPT